MKPETWTPERLAALQREVAAGTTYSAIAKMLGITKNMAVGKAIRMGFGRAPEAVLNPAQAKRKQRYNPEAEAPQPANGPFPPPGRCVFPHGDPGEHGFHFCGGPVDAVGLPYCREHMRVTHVSVARSEAIKAAWTEERRIRMALLTRERLARGKAA